MAQNPIDDYIKAFPPKTQTVLKQIRTTIKKAAPEAVESISYGIPTFKTPGARPIYFAGYKTHISIHPVSDQAVQSVKSLAKYRTGKGTAQFPLSEAIPLDLIAKFAKFQTHGITKDPGLPEKFPAPAMRALANANIYNLKDLKKHTEKEISQLHGMGPKAVTILKSEMSKRKLSFKK